MIQNNSKTGVLLVNLGTPEAPHAAAVRRYLREFLMDPDVVDLPAPLRWFLVHGIILPRRPKRSAEAYQKIWTERGSPLLFHTLDLAREVQKKVDGKYYVLPAMRYGSPSIGSAMRGFKSVGIERVLAIPLYPQYSMAATESSVKMLKQTALEEGIECKIFGDFYSDRGFVSAFSHVIGETLSQVGKWDHLLFSFHGLPERQIRKMDPTREYCLVREDCCYVVCEKNRKCYRAQSYATAELIAGELGLEKNTYSVSFQSRLGVTDWIKPYTDFVLSELVSRGVRRLVVACPAFVADCLETLEEIQIRETERFIKLGGEKLVLAPSLNSRPEWVKCISGWVQNEFSQSN